jgi:glycerol-3-phosphate dehydrogenase (NAD(P)+)
MIGIAGAGAFGTALAVALARGGRAVTLWARDPAQVALITRTRCNARHLPDVVLPDSVFVAARFDDLLPAAVVLLAVPMQTLRMFLQANASNLNGLALVACCKGLDLETGLGPWNTMANGCPASDRALLTGPGFAIDIAQGLPTALTLAGGSDALQGMLSTPTLRLYRTDDVIGAELGGALKNVIAIAAGVVIGAGLGVSARAALMTRGFAEMVRLATSLGAQAETLAGLSGLGDLVLTSTSPQSRNFCYGMALGQGKAFDPGVTVEGAATAIAIARLAQERGIDMPISHMVADLIEQKTTLSAAIDTLLSRPLKRE